MPVVPFFEFCCGGVHRGHGLYQINSRILFLPSGSSKAYYQTCYILLTI